MDLRFNYEYTGESFFGGIYRPVAKVAFVSPRVSDKIVSVWMIVDSGADYSILPHHLSEKLRVSFEQDCVTDTTYGVGGQRTVYFLKDRIKVQIGNIQKSVPLAFFDSDEIPPLLGRQGFMETFDVEFLKSRIVVFKS